MDPSSVVLVLAVIGIVILGPAVISRLGEGMPDSISQTIRMFVGALIVGGMQLIAIIFVVLETYWNTLKRGERSGLDRAPFLQGWRGPIVILLCYGAGIVRLLKATPQKELAIYVYAGLAAVTLLAAVVADLLGRKKRNF